MLEKIIDLIKTEKNVTELRNTTLDKDRVFHLSYMNKSGNPGDSIAIIW